MKALFILLSLVLISSSSPVLAQECPFGIEDDPAPGQCRLYIDKNGDHFCDYSESGTKAEPNKDETKAQNEKGSDNSKDNDYHLPELLAAFLLSEIILMVLLRTKRITMPSFKKLNNWALLLSFLVVAVSSVPFLLSVSGLSTPSGLRDWSVIHTDSGLLMILLSIEHALRRWRLFLPIKAKRSE